VPLGHTIVRGDVVRVAGNPQVIKRQDLRACGHFLPHYMVSTPGRRSQSQGFTNEQGASDLKQRVQVAHRSRTQRFRRSCNAAPDPVHAPRSMHAVLQPDVVNDGMQSDLHWHTAWSLLQHHLSVIPLTTDSVCEAGDTKVTMVTWCK
jgi:alpha-beta hydrolase superfamily lysophospholipase